MTRTVTRFSALALLCLSLGCQKHLSKEATSTGSTTRSEETCEPTVYSLIDDGDLAVGELSVWNDETTVYVKFTASGDRWLSKASGVIGSYQHLQQVAGNDWDPAVGATPPDFSATYAPEVKSDTFTFPVSTVFATLDCIWLNVHAVLVRKDQSGNIIETTYAWANGPEYITSYAFSRSFEFCRMTCTPPPPPPPPPGDCDTLRTQTPGGWGAVPSGNNPGAYLHANFDAAFGGVLRVGCYPGNYYVELSSAQAITDLLPTGGQASVLNANYTNPPAMKNVLVGHLVALKLSTGFDAWDADFGKGGIALGSMKIGSGTFEGWTVAEFIAEADKVLGGCSTGYTPGQILATATAINENYIVGAIDNGFLVCPE